MTFFTFFKYYILTKLILGGIGLLILIVILGIGFWLTYDSW
jgi:uncharacterized membrane protein